MKVTYIITVSPVLPRKYLNLLVKSLNYQDCENFDAIFYNQTAETKEELLANIEAPRFDFRILSHKETRFFGGYPLWDLYRFHEYLLQNNLVQDYFMSLHMEEFLEPDYTSSLLQSLRSSSADIMLGNLNTVSLSYIDIEPSLKCISQQTYGNWLKEKVCPRARRWGTTSKPWFLTRRPFNNIKKALVLNRNGFLPKTEESYLLMRKYLFEDIYAMRKEFAIDCGWFAISDNVYFEDIHINWRIEKYVKSMTSFPLYFTGSRVFHLKHPKYYYQVENPGFTAGIMKLDTANPTLCSLQNEIRRYKSKEISSRDALINSRKNGTIPQIVEHFKSISKG